MTRWPDPVDQHNQRSHPARIPPGRTRPGLLCFGTHDEVREHYGTAPGQYPDHATTLDYVVAAAAGWLTGTLGGALEAGGIDASEGLLSSEAEGEIYLEDKVLVIKKIRVRYTLIGCPDDKREAADRAHAFHSSRCPVAKSVEKAIEISTELTFA